MKRIINLTVECDVVAVDEARLQTAVQRILDDAQIGSAQIGIAVLSDSAIRQLNKQYLDHDYATDAISFVLEQTPDHLEGEIAVSAETARRQAARLGWDAGDELLLYVVHGMLHLVGEDDMSEAAAERMRQREREVLGEFGLVPPWEGPDAGRRGGKNQRSREELTR